MPSGNGRGIRTDPDEHRKEWEADHPRRDHQLSKTEITSLSKIDEGFPTRMDIEKPGNEAGRVFPVGPARFWNERYVKDPSPMEWYQRWYSLCPKLTEDGNLKPAQTVLHVGCGNSRLCEDMYRDGYQRQTNIDFSHVVIAQQRERYVGSRAMPGVEWHEMDCRDMGRGERALGDHKFHVVIDKACLDVLMCGDDAVEGIHKYLTDVSRVLKSGGTFVCVSHGEPASRLPIFTGQKAKAVYGWEVSHKTLPKEGISAAMVARGEKEWAAKLEKQAVAAAAKLEKEAREAREELEMMALGDGGDDGSSGGGKDGIVGGGGGASVMGAARAEVAVGDAESVARVVAGKEAKKKPKKKKKRKVHQKMNKDGTLEAIITDPRR